MGRFQRVIGTDGRFSGTWVVLLASGKHRASVRPHDVTVYDAKDDLLALLPLIVEAAGAGDPS